MKDTEIRSCPELGVIEECWQQLRISPSCISSMTIVIERYAIKSSEKKIMEEIGKMRKEQDEIRHRLSGYLGKVTLFYPNVEFILDVGSDDHISMVFYTLTRDTKYVFN